jgi:hypothetical protein
VEQRCGSGWRPKTHGWVERIQQRVLAGCLTGHTPRTAKVAWSGSCTTNIFFCSCTSPSPPHESRVSGYGVRSLDSTAASMHSLAGRCQWSCITAAGGWGTRLGVSRHDTKAQSRGRITRMQHREEYLGARDVRRQVWVEEVIKVGSPPHARALTNLPVCRLPSHR